MMTRDQMKVVLEALSIGHDCAIEVASDVHEKYRGYKHERHVAVDKDVVDIIAAIRILQAALAEPSEPVYWQWRRKDKPWENAYIFAMEVQATTDDSEVRKLFTHPAPSKPEPLPELTDEEIDEACKDIWGSDYGVPLSCSMQRDIARAILAAAREKA